MLESVNLELVKTCRDMAALMRTSKFRTADGPEVSGWGVWQSGHKQTAARQRPRDPRHTVSLHFLSVSPKYHSELRCTFIAIRQWPRKYILPYKNNHIGQHKCIRSCIVMVIESRRRTNTCKNIASNHRIISFRHIHYFKPIHHVLRRQNLPIAKTRYNAFASSNLALRRLKCAISAESASCAGSTMFSLISEL